MGDTSPTPSPSPSPPSTDVGTGGTLTLKSRRRPPSDTVRNEEWLTAPAAADWVPSDTVRREGWAKGAWDGLDGCMPCRATPPGKGAPAVGGATPGPCAPASGPADPFGPPWGSGSLGTPAVGPPSARGTPPGTDVSAAVMTREEDRGDARGRRTDMLRRFRRLGMALAATRPTPDPGVPGDPAVPGDPGVPCATGVPEPGVEGLAAPDTPGGPGVDRAPSPASPSPSGPAKGKDREEPLGLPAVPPRPDKDTGEPRNDEGDPGSLSLPTVEPAPSRKEKG